MTARRPRRRRRRDAAASTLPRPIPGEQALRPSAPTSAADEPRARGRREHHAATDFRYVRSDLIGIAIVGSVTLGFVIAMAIILG